MVVPQYRIAQAAALLGVSDDTVRRWVDSGRLAASIGDGVTTIDGADLASHAQEIARAPELGAPVLESARNRFTGLVTKVVKDTVMAQVDLQCGPFRVVSLMSAEAATNSSSSPACWPSPRSSRPTSWSRSRSRNDPTGPRDAVCRVRPDLRC